MILMMYTAIHVMQMAGGLVQQSSLDVPLRVGGWMRMREGGTGPPRVSAVNGLK